MIWPSSFHDIRPWPVTFNIGKGQGHFNQYKSLFSSDTLIQSMMFISWIVFEIWKIYNNLYMHYKAHHNNIINYLTFIKFKYKYIRGIVQWRLSPFIELRFRGGKLTEKYEEKWKWYHHDLDLWHKVTILNRVPASVQYNRQAETASKLIKWFY